MSAMRRWLALAGLLLLAGCGEAAALDRLAPAGEGRVSEVIAADLVLLDDGEAVKLAGLASLRRRDPYGKEAAAALEALTLGQEVELLSGGAARDPFGRRVAHLRLVKGRRWVQGEMLAQGAARVRTFPDNRALAAEMLEREARARAKGAGLWALKHYQVRLPAETRRDRGFQVVEGRVTAVRPLGRAYELDVQGLRAEIPARAVADFEAAGKAPASLAGRLVRMRGTMRGGPSLRLDHPETVELLRDP
ncbi:MAG TPA: thermonuclease family protein [Caulobacteraceae bacterium]|nr:thermonuclease family protein [Caulobacteraceae bacterium]